MASLASVDDLDTYMGGVVDPTQGQLYLDIASDLIRDLCGRALDLVTNDVLVLDPVNGVVFLPRPVASVSLVEVYSLDTQAWTSLASTDWVLDPHTGRVAMSPKSLVTWPCQPGSVRVTCTHGTNPIPDSIRGLCLSLAGRWIATPLGVSQEHIGTYQVMYSAARDSLTPMDQMVIALHRDVVVA